MSQLDQLPAGAVVRARPWDVIGAGLAAPMLLWGFLGWFGTVGDSGGGLPGFYSGTGATGIGLVLAAAALTTNQLLAGRPHQRDSPPVSVLLAAGAAIVILGGMVAKPDSATIQAGSVAGLLTALSQGLVLTRGWLQGSQKSVKAANVRAWNERQAAADLAGQQARGWPPPGGYPPPAYGGSPQGYGSGLPAYGGGTGGWPAATTQPATGGYPPVPVGGYPPAAGYPPPGGFPQPPAPRYPQFPPPSYRPAGPPPGNPSASGPAYPARYPAGPPPGHQSGPPGYPAASGGPPPAS